MIEHVNLQSWPSTYGFSQAVRVTDPGTWLFLSGIGSENATGTAAEAEGDIMAQCRRIWANILEILEQQGGSPRDIIRVRIYVTDARHMADVVAARFEVLGEGPYPTSTFLQVAGLAQPGMLVEIEVDAVLS